MQLGGAIDGGYFFDDGLSVGGDVVMLSSFFAMGWDGAWRFCQMEVWSCD